MYIKFAITAILILAATGFWLARKVAGMLATGITGGSIPMPTEGTDKRQWNTQWESYVFMMNRIGNPIIIHQIAYSLSTMGHRGATQSLLEHLRINYPALWSMQGALTEKALSGFVRDHLERRWQAIDATSREEHLLEGLARTCAQPKGADQHRLMCPELSLANMQEGDGQGFLDLLKSYILDDYFTRPQKPFFLPNIHYDYSQVDETRLSEDEKIFREYLSVDRNMFITRFLMNTLDSFYGLEPSKLNTSKSPTHHRGLSDQQKTLLGYVFGRSAVKAVKTSMRNLRKELESDSAYRCENCRKSEQESERKFSACAPCRTTVNRRVLYCSRRCQKEDWKSRHRNICGRLLTLEDAQTTVVGRGENQPLRDASAHQEMIGPATHGFTRSINLKYIVHYVNALRISHPEAHVEYILFSTSGEPRPVSMDNDCFRRILRLYSMKAMTTGDRMAVVTLGQYFISAAEEFQTTRCDILTQLNREYGINVEANVRELEESDPAFTKMEKEWQMAEDEGV